MWLHQRHAHQLQLQSYANGDPPYSPVTFIYLCNKAAYPMTLFSKKVKVERF